MNPLRRPLRPLAFAAAALAVAAAPVRAQWGPQQPGVVDEQATMANRLGERAELSGVFRDELDRPIRIQELMSPDRPLVLNLGYFSCPGMCGMVLNSLLRAVEDSAMTPGADFDLVTVSIDDREGPALASDKKSTYVTALGHPAWTERWHLLTGDRATIDALSSSVGWRFRKDAATGQYDHPPMVVLVSPSGVTTRYLDARYLDGRTLRRAVVESSDGKIGTFVERVLVSCLTFDPNTGAYTVTAMTVMRIGGLVAVLAIASMIIVLWRRERRRQAATTASPATAG
ncbi:MAG: SCO family protein [Planctomycetes bacterium]|nr:SCO family protein [Planctomycetota bacterium]